MSLKDRLAASNRIRENKQQENKKALGVETAEQEKPGETKAAKEKAKAEETARIEAEKKEQEAAKKRATEEKAKKEAEAKKKAEEEKAKKEAEAKKEKEATHAPVERITNRETLDWIYQDPEIQATASIKIDLELHEKLKTLSMIKKTSFQSITNNILLAFFEDHPDLDKKLQKFMKGF